MSADEFLTTATAVLALLFSLALFDQWRERRGAFQLAWGIGMLFFGIAAAASSRRCSRISTPTRPMRGAAQAARRPRPSSSTTSLGASPQAASA